MYSDRWQLHVYYITFIINPAANMTIVLYRAVLKRHVVLIS